MSEFVNGAAYNDPAAAEPAIPPFSVMPKDFDFPQEEHHGVQNVMAKAAESGNGGVKAEAAESGEDLEPLLSQLSAEDNALVNKITTCEFCKNTSQVDEYK